MGARWNGWSLGGIRIIISTSCRLASAFGVSDFLTTIFSGTFEDVSFTKALEKWVALMNQQKCPLDGAQKKWTIPVPRQNRTKFDF